MSLTRAFEKLSKIQEITTEYPHLMRSREPVQVIMPTGIDREQNELYEASGFVSMLFSTTFLATEDLM